MPEVPAGAPAPSAPLAALVGPLSLRFEFAPNVAPSWSGAPSPSVVYDKAAFAGLTPGLAGLYQVNFRVPVPPSGTPACLSGSGAVQSNLTVTMYQGYIDGARLCVQVPDPAGASAK